MIPISESAVSVGTSYTTLATIYPGGGHRDLVLRISSAAGSATLTDFRLTVMAHADDSDFEPLLGDTDWGAGTSDTLVFCTSTVPNTLAASGDAMVKVNIAGFYAVRLDAKVAASTASITLQGQAV